MLSVQVLQHTHTGDYDFFLVVPSLTADGRIRTEDSRQQRACALVEQTLKALKEATALHDSYAVFTPTCVTWLLDGDNERVWGITEDSEETLKVQIINRMSPQLRYTCMYNTSHIDAVQPCSVAWLCVQWQAFQSRASHKLWVCLSFENSITAPLMLLLNHSIGRA